MSKSLVVGDEMRETRHRLMPMEEPLHKHSMQVAQQVGYASLNKEVRKDNESKLVPIIKLQHNRKMNTVLDRRLSHQHLKPNTQWR